MLSRRLAALTALSCVAFGGCQNSTRDGPPLLLHRAETIARINAFGEARYGGPCTITETRVGDKEVVVLSGLVGSGAPYAELHVYVRDGDVYFLHLHLRPIRPRAEVEGTERALVIREDNGTVLVELLAAALR